jgi:hypothetical protein
MANEFQRAITTALAQYVASAVPSLAKVTPEWPTANSQLVYPSLTVLTVGEVRFIPLSSSVVYLSAPSGASSSTNYLCGHYEPRLQLDLWCSNKIQRAEMYELVWKALNPDAKNMGVRIQLDNYFNEWASYVMTSYSFLDGNEQTQKQEWRCIIRVDALCNAIMNQTESVMANIVLAGEPTVNYAEEL